MKFINRATKVIHAETILDGGFFSKLRGNVIDEAAFQRLIGSINELTELYLTKEEIPKIALACLFEGPWEIENSVRHYKNKDPKLGERVSQMAEDLRESIEGLLWGGLEEYYQ